MKRTCSSGLISLIAGVVLLAPMNAHAFDGVGDVDVEETRPPTKAPLIVALALTSQRHPDIADRLKNRGFGISFELSRWFGESAYGTLLGAEVETSLGSLWEPDGEDGEGETYANVELHPKLVIGLVPHRFKTPVALSLLAGYSIEGWDDVWWDERGRHMGTVAARIFAFEYVMLEYMRVAPLSRVEPPAFVADGFRRSEHRVRLRLMGVQEGGAAATFQYTHGIVRSAARPEPVIDRQFLFMIGGFVNPR